MGIAIPPASLGFWIERLLSHGIKYEGPARRFDEQVLSFADPDGLLLELVASSRAAGIPAWEDGPLAPEHGIRGLHGTTLWEDGDTGTADLLVNTLGFEAAGEQGGLVRFQVAGPGLGRVVYLRQARGFWGGPTESERYTMSRSGPPASRHNWRSEQRSRQEGSTSLR